MTQFQERTSRRLALGRLTLGFDEKAARLREKAALQRRRFDEAFWDEAVGFHAYCLDGNKRKIVTVDSNPGHLLWSGTVPKEKAGNLAEELLRSDMWSVWGIRPLFGDHPSFNPHSYQHGSIWSHDTA